MNDRERFLFLDIDGVLNDHTRHPNGYCGIDPACMYRLNRIVAATGAKLVISSAWRYLLNTAMSVDGFHYMLMTYGLATTVHISGRTGADELCPDRGDQIAAWLADYRAFKGHDPVYVVLDDGSDEEPHPPSTKPLTKSLQERCGDRWVRTDGTKGLTDADADKVIRLFAPPATAAGE